MQALPWVLLGVAVLFLGLACRAAGQAPYADMGTQMAFSSHWLFGSLAAGAGAGMLAAWWAGVLATVAVFALRWPLYRLFEGRWAAPEPPPKDGFKQFIRRTEKTD